MSPEQARGERADARSDIFSLGVVMYEMIAGRLPFKGKSSVDVMHGVMHDEPPALESACRSVSSRLSQRHSQRTLGALPIHRGAPRRPPRVGSQPLRTERRRSCRQVGIVSRIEEAAKDRKPSGSNLFLGFADVKRVAAAKRRIVGGIIGDSGRHAVDVALA